MKHLRKDDNLTLIESLFYSIEPPQNKKPLDLVQLISRTVDTLSFRYLASEVQLCFLSDEDFLAFLGDEEYIEEILLGLLGNAYRLTKVGDDIYVRLSRFEDQGIPFACIVVEDNGQGISPEEMEYIFCDLAEDPESTCIRRLTEAGLSLARIEKLVILHEGGICADSKVGVGSIYKVALPLIYQRPPENRPLEA